MPLPRTYSLLRMPVYAWLHVASQARRIAIYSDFLVITPLYRRAVSIIWVSCRSALNPSHTEGN